MERPPLNTDYPLGPIAWAQQQLSQYGRIGATRLIKVPDLTVPIAVAPSAPVQAPVLTWRDNGTVIALYGQERLGTVFSFANTSFRLVMKGDIDLTSNGSTGDFSPLLAVVGPNVNWFPMTRRVARGDVWTVTWRNDQIVAAIFPTMIFAFIADTDMAKMARDWQDSLNTKP